MHSPLTLTPGATRKADPNPVGVHVLAQLVPRPGDLEDGPVAALDRDDERRLQHAALGEVRVLRPDQVGADHVARPDDVMHLAAGLPRPVLPAGGRVGVGPGRVVGEHPLRAAQVGDAHRRQQHAAQLLRRERDRHADDATEDAAVAQEVPERPALAEQPDVGLAERDAVLPQAERAPRRPDLDRAQLRRGRCCRSGVRKSKMLCLPGFVPVWNVDHATGEIGGTVVPSGLKQPCSRSASRCGSLPSAEHPLGQRVVHAVQPEDDDPLEPAAQAPALRRRPATAAEPAR